MRPAEQLKGLRLSGGWTVLDLATRAPQATGGKFSTGYVVAHDDGRRGFLKAMDYIEALQHPDTLQVMQALTQAYLFEKGICEKCRDGRLSRVVHAIDSGTIQPDPSNPAGKVEYLIFELADGDIRAHLNTQTAFDLAFGLRALHHVAVGLEQLHRSQMAHQDLKPSNVLVFSGGAGSKLSDLGRSWCKNLPAPHDTLPVAGQFGYAPPELLYQYFIPDEMQRRFACDMYHLGSLIVFVFARTHMTALLATHLAPMHQWNHWGDGFRKVLPYIQAAFGTCLNDLDAATPQDIRPQIRELVSYLCEPDPDLRGHPLNRRGVGSPYSLERFISTLNVLATRAEYHLVTP